LGGVVSVRVGSGQAGPDRVVSRLVGTGRVGSRRFRRVGPCRYWSGRTGPGVRSDWVGGRVGSSHVSRDGPGIVEFLTSKGSFRLVTGRAQPIRAEAG